MAIVDELNEIAIKMGKPNLISERTGLTTELQKAYESYPSAKAEARSKIFSDQTLQQLGQYEQQVTQQLFTEPTSYLTEMSNPDSPNYVADPLKRLNFASERQGTVISKLLGIKKSIEKRKGDLQDLLNAWSDEYENQLALKKLKLQELEDAFSLAFDISKEQERRKEAQQQVALKEKELAQEAAFKEKELKLKEETTRATAQSEKYQKTQTKWLEFVKNATNDDGTVDEYKIWQQIDTNMDALRVAGYDVDLLWQWHSQLVGRTKQPGQEKSSGNVWSRFWEVLRGY